MVTKLITPYDSELGWHQPDEECQVMEDMTTPSEDKIIDEIIPTFAEELSSYTGIDANDLKNWKASYWNKNIDTRLSVKYALMKIYFKDMLVESIGGAYDRTD
tara:strand:- start:131 stop:439 length:309 start_codon:yes stop_codon:yes gene_type:complete